MVIIDSGKLAPNSQVKFLVDSGVKKTLLSEEEWRKIKLGAGDNKPRLKRCKTKFTHYGTREYLPIMGYSKCSLQAEAEAWIRTMVYVVKGNEQSLLRLQDAIRLRIIHMDTHWRKQR